MENKLYNFDLYQFEKLAAALDKWGYPTIKSESGFQIIKGIDFEKAYKAGDIRFEEDGIYLDYEGQGIKGYMFIREYFLEKYGTYPKFHIVKCKTIQEFLNNGKFDQRYDFSNTEMNDLIDKNSRKTYEDEILNLCANCRTQVKSEIETTQDFYSVLEDQYKMEDIEVDIFGYAKGWDLLSRTYRELREYTCEDCKIKIEKALDKRFIHVHHIDGIKTNNIESNLKSLCILCHANQNALHIENFRKGSMKIELAIFIEKYKNKLTILDNRYLKT